MSSMIDSCEVVLWGKTVGIAYWDAERRLAFFEYDPIFVKSDLEVAPLKMPLTIGRSFSFPNLRYDTYFGLPGLLADALPDYFGNQVIHAYLVSQGRSPDSFSPIEKLCYVGKRGIGALEFKPAVIRKRKSQPVAVNELAVLAEKILKNRGEIRSVLNPDDAAFHDILQVGSSAGGARPKALIAWNRQTNEVYSGQVEAPPGFEYWLLKFASRDDRKEYGRIEYSYYLMAQAAGIEMNECRLLEDHGVAHFMTRRFDRTNDGRKTHLQSFCALGHYDFNDPFSNTYESAFQLMRKLKIDGKEQLFRRMIFNIAARNQDDHTKNIAFLMDTQGKWTLSPAYDMSWAYKHGLQEWTSRHQMSVCGKHDHITKNDILTLAEHVEIPHARTILEEVLEAANGYLRFAAAAQVDSAIATRMFKQFHLLA